MFVIIDMGECCHYVLRGGVFSTRGAAEAYKAAEVARRVTNEAKSRQEGWGGSHEPARAEEVLHICELETDPAWQADSEIWP